MIQKDDVVFAVWGERCSGPGWANAPYWVLFKRGGDWIVEAIQPKQQTEFMYRMHHMSDEINSLLVGEVVTKISGRRAGS